MRKTVYFWGAVCAVGCWLATDLNAQVKIKPSDIGGVVTSANGPEAGVWVIAETTDLPTRYIKEVVTDGWRGAALRRGSAAG